MNSTRSAVRLHRNPQLAPGLSALVPFLIDQHYSSHAIGRIEAYVATHGTLAGSIIEPEDEAAAEEAFVASLPAVDASSGSWDRDGGVYLDVPMLIEMTHPWPVPDGGFDDDRTIPPDAALLPPELDPDDDDADIAAIGRFLESLPPISGGAPEPSEADRADFEQWLDQVDADYPPEDQAEQMRAWYAANRIESFNADRLD
jgi:hypothetical protein